MAHTRAHRKAQRRGGQAMGESSNQMNMSGMNTATLGLVLAGAIGTALGLLFGTEGGANVRRGISKRANSLMKSYERAMSPRGRARTAGAAA